DAEPAHPLARIQIQPHLAQEHPYLDMQGGPAHPAGPRVDWMAAHEDILSHAEIGEESWFLIDDRHAGVTRLRGVVEMHWHAVLKNLAGIGRMDACQH